MFDEHMLFFVPSRIGISYKARKYLENTGLGTKSQQALQRQREEMKTERRQISREERKAEAQRRFEMKQAKKKEKRRGH